MRSFDELTKAGRTARLRMLAASTLRDEFGIEPLRVSLLAAHSFNTVFRVDTTSRERLAVRVGEVRIHADRVEEVEAHWLDTLRRDSDLAVPTLLPDRRGRHMTAGSHPLVPGARFCSVLAWVPGRIVRETFDHRTARELGVISAQLHDQATSYLPPEVPAGIVANRVLYFGDTSRLASFESSYGSMFVEAVARVQDRLDALWRAQPHPPHLLHGDFGPQNVMRYRSRLTPIDFQDLQFGFDVQDIAITLTDLRRLYSDESFVDAFMAGYRSVRSWPLNDPSLERALGAARSLNVISLGLNLRRAGLSEFVHRHAALVEEWMTGLAPKSAVI